MIPGTEGKARVAVDPVIFTIKDGSLHVFLNQREMEPFLKKHELPGGLLRGNETAEESLQRKLEELWGKKDIFFKQFHTFTDPQRDPRERIITIGFVTLINPKEEIKTGGWYNYKTLPPLAFDHQQIIRKARSFLKEQLTATFICQFLPPLFPLNQLQEVYESIEEKKYDNRNFRKRMILSEIVEETKHREKNVSHRPAKLFKFRD